MDYRTYTSRVKYLHEMIKKGSLSSPSAVADKFNCSERTIRRMVNHLRSEGLDIRYCKKRKKYIS